MKVLVVGSTALDSIRTPRRAEERLLGGSASYAAVAASCFAPVRLVGVVGEDFPRRYLALYRRRRIDLEGLQQAAGRTFHWSGEYEVNLNRRRTLTTELGVFADFTPTLPAAWRGTPYVLLANIAPALQHHVLDQMERPRWVVADTMDLWLNTALPELLRLLRRIDAIVLNDSEACQLSGVDNVILAARRLHRLGPRHVIVKKGEHGAIASTPDGCFVCPAYPLASVADPTGAGDSFVGGMMGYLAGKGGAPGRHLRQAMVYGSVIASFCCEGFGLSAIARLARPRIEARATGLRRMARF
ncbi:MAG TPA: PfkB family carbohydrate kinase [Verrucomicrobiota bacterium]|nr:PfkB family carbohydrate kinase [Verrucomicrobiota bacterium]HNU49388.1 PfkB family carbohydrate kinase [Verrucomicrobiota bacterium]